MSIEDAANAIAAKYQSGGEKGSNPSVTSDNPFSMFLNSLVSAAGPEMIGHEASPEVQQYRTEHPILGTVSELASPFGEYGAVMKIGKLPKVAGMLDKVGEADSIWGNAKRNATLFGAGIEGPRTALSAVTGGDVGETGSEALINTALELGFGGLGGYFRAAGKVDKKLTKLGSSVDLKQPPQVIAQDVIKAIEEGKISEEDIPHARNIISNIEDSIRNETLSGEDKYIKELDSGDAQPLNRLFKYSTAPQNSPISKKLLIPGSFDTPQELDDVITNSGLKDNFPYVQFPRFVAASNESGAKAIESTLREGGLKSVGENTFLGKEKSGLYVMAKKLEDNKWVMFKTSAPGRFSKSAQKWGDQIADRNAWMIDPPYKPNPEAPLDILDEATTTADALPIQGFYQAVTGKVGKAMGRLEKMVGLEGDSEAIKRVKASFRENFAPAMYEFKSNPRAQWVFAQARNITQKAENMAHALTYGDEAIAKGGSITGKLLANASLSGKFGDKAAVAKIVEGLDQEHINQLVKAADTGLEGKALDEALAKGTVSKEVYDALRSIQPLDEYQQAQILGTQAATGDKGFHPIKGHYMLPRTWKGTWRVPVRNERDKLVYMASGNTREQAIKMAQKITSAPDTKGWKAGEAITADSNDDVALAMQVAAGSPEYMTAAALRNKLVSEASKPKSFKVRTGVGGYEDAFTKDELVSKFYDSALARNRYVADMTIRKVLGDQLAKVGVEDAQLYRELNRRIDSMLGRQGPISKIINQEVDKVFAPSLGKNSASTIAKTINMYSHELTLGMGNLAYPAMNALTFVQTVMPRIAFTLNATDESLARCYSFLPLKGLDGRVKGDVGFLEPMKLMLQSMKEMGKPDELLSRNISKGIREGVVDPKFIEEWAGQNSKNVKNMKDTLKQKDGFSSYIKSISSYLPTQSEKLSRGNALVVGHIVGRDFFKLEDEALYRFAKEFTEKTMFNYTAADRPRVFTGPLGSVFGQFKTWTSHYIANSLEYLGEGFKYDNWSPFMWQLGGTTALGGVSATALWPVASGFNDWLGDKSLMSTLYDRMGGGSGDSMMGNAADGVFHGLPMFLGLSLSGQASDPLSDPSRTASMLFSFVQMQRVKQLSQAIGQGIDNYAVTGEHPINSEETRDLFIGALAPKTISRAAAIVEGNAVKSLNTGNKLYDGLNIAEKLMYVGGFMPKRMALQHDVNEELWKDQASLKAKVTTYGRLWHEAKKEQDWQTLTDLQNRALQEGVPLDSIIRSARSQSKGTDKPQMDRQFKPAKSVEFKNLNIVE